MDVLIPAAAANVTLITYRRLTRKVQMLSSCTFYAYCTSTTAAVISGYLHLVLILLASRSLISGLQSDLELEAIAS